MNRKIVVIALSVALSLSLTSCGNQPAPEDSSPETEQEELANVEPVSQSVQEPQEEVEVEAPDPLNDAESLGESASVDEVAPVEEVDLFDAVEETVYATGTVNIRESWSADSAKLGSLSAGQSVTRTGTGTGEADGWSQVTLSDGSTAYIASSYLSTTKPVVNTNNNSGGNSGKTTQTQQSQTQQSQQSQTQQSQQAPTPAPAPSGGSGGLSAEDAAALAALEAMGSGSLTHNNQQTPEELAGGGTKGWDTSRYH